MKKREFLKTSAAATLGAAILPSTLLANRSTTVEEFVLPDLPYAYDALVGAIDAQTMEIHHSKHHAGYVRKLNGALEGHQLQGNDLVEIMSSVTTNSADTGVRNNGGGHFNHSLFWIIMTPGGTSGPTGNLAKQIDQDFKSFDGFKEQFVQAAGTRFGSGWAWLVADKKGKLTVTSTPNQDNPMMERIVANPGVPILGIDVWEHAYYLKYQNRRADYINAFMSVVNWDAVSENFAKA